MRVKVTKGFTLIEVLAALAIFSTVFVALMMQSSRMLSWQSGIDHRVLAMTVAQNHLAAIRVEREWPNLGTTEYDVKQAGLEWRLTTEVKSTPYKDLRKVSIRVFEEDGENSLVSIDTFVGEH